MLFSRCVSGNVDKAREENEKMSRQALRVIAIAVKEIEEIPEELNSSELENGLTFKGLVGRIDPPRPEAKEAVSVCRKAGIRPVMITGDHVVTVSYTHLDVYKRQRLPVPVLMEVIRIQ